MAAPNEHINSFVEENLEDASKQDNIYCAALAYYKRMCHLYDSNIRVICSKIELQIPLLIKLILWS